MSINGKPETKPSKDQAASSLISRNVTVSGHRTSVRLEPEMWHGLMEIGRRERASIHEVCTAVGQRKAANTSLTAAIRVFIMAYFRNAASEEGHTRAGHGKGIFAFSTSMAPVATVRAFETSRAV